MSRLAPPSTASGWFRAPASAWPLVAELMPKPWPREAVALDLAWWEDQVRTERAARIPGHIEMGRRWGWPERATRNALRSLGESVPAPSRQRPGTVPAASRLTTDDPQLSNESVPAASRQRPGSVQHARVFREQRSDPDNRGTPPRGAAPP